MNKAANAMSALNFIWDSDETALLTKQKNYHTIVVNLLLWGCENWSCNQTDITSIEAFHTKAIRRILKIKMSRVIDEKITN